MMLRSRHDRLHRGSIPLVALCCWCVFLYGCGSQFTAARPEGFAHYPDKYNVYKAVSPDRIVFRVRTVPNKPYAGLPFWREAALKRMADAGYRLISDTTILMGADTAALIELAAPLGQTDYSYLIAFTVGKKNIIIAESAGEFLKLRDSKDAIVKALTAIRAR